MQLKMEFGFGEERELEYSYSDEEEFVSEEEIDEPKFDSDGYDFVEDKLVFGEDGLVIEVVSLFEVPQELEEAVRDVDINNDSHGLIAKAKVLKFATNDGICVDGYLHDFSSQNNVLFYLFKHIETSCDDFSQSREDAQGYENSRTNFYQQGKNDEDGDHRRHVRNNYSSIEFEDKFSQPGENDAN
ncbi:hypothetical protein Sjap_006315 [Stephania japonica]|uniref:Uncharacterized protein n=1 Tax=Stephania japonica TaxID=461633 RepID=A0AAP0K5N7_9MAGN